MVKRFNGFPEIQALPKCPFWKFNQAIEPFTPTISFVEIVETIAERSAGQVQDTFYSLEAFMWKKTLTFAVLGIAGAMPVLAAGCASNSDKPNAVTGQMATSGQDPAAYDQFGTYHSDWEGKPNLNPRFQDDKHHYRPEWVGSPGH